MIYAGVAVDVPLNKIFYYSIPEEFQGLIAIGDRVIVPFANRKMHGIVVELATNIKVDEDKLKSIISLATPQERVPEDILKLSKWLANYYLSCIGTVLAAAIPSGIKHNKHLASKNVFTLNIPFKDIKVELKKLQVKAPKQALILQQIQKFIKQHDREYFTCEEISSDANSNNICHALVKKNILTVAKTSKLSVPEIYQENKKNIILSSDQITAIENINLALKKKEYKSFLLHGVTGSGKTEVYLQVMDYALKNNTTVLVLVPEISLTPQTVARFQERTGKIAVLHSSLSDSERAEYWRRINTGEFKVVVGARSAIFAPLKDLGLIIVDEEHERSYKQENDPRYNARDLALVRGKFNNAVVILGSATPSFESWQNTINSKHELLSLPERAGKAIPPEAVIVDLRQEWAEVKKPVIFSRELEKALINCLKNKEQAILFLNRRGFHTSILCAACGEVIKCQACDIALTHHKKEHLLRCHYCDSDLPFPKQCPYCSATALRFLGTGTEKVEEVLQSILPNAKLLRMDSDTMNKKHAHAKALSAFANKEYDILLGTQMITKGLDFPNVTLVGVLMADVALGMSDFRASERTFQLVTQVIGRSGRGEKPGVAIVQAFQPEHPSIEYAIKQNYQGFFSTEITDRKPRNYPPFGRLARIIILGKNDSSVKQTATIVAKKLHENIPEKCRIIGPSSCEIEKIQENFRHHILLFSPNHKTLNNWCKNALSLTGINKNVKISLDIDPLSLQ